MSMQDVHSRVNELLTRDERIEFYAERNQELAEIEGFWKHLVEVNTVLANLASTGRLS